MMKPLKTAVIGMGTMGSKYAAFLLKGQVPAMELAAVTRVRPERLKTMNLTLPDDLPVWHPFPYSVYIRCSDPHLRYSA